MVPDLPGSKLGTYVWIDREVRVRYSTAMSYRAATLVANTVLAVLAFSQGTQVWDIVGAVLAGFAIGDLIMITTAAWFRRRHRGEWGNKG